MAAMGIIGLSRVVPRRKAKQPCGIRSAKAPLRVGFSFEKLATNPPRGVLLSMFVPTARKDPNAEKLRARLLEDMQPQRASSCWQWSGWHCFDTPMYGKNNARVWVWRAWHPDEDVGTSRVRVRDICGNSACVNPKHLYALPAGVSAGEIVLEEDNNGLLHYAGRRQRSA